MTPSNLFIQNYNQSLSSNSRDLVVEFFITFSRFEFALKATNFLPNGNNQKAVANWDSFINSIRDLFQPNEEEALNHACNFILNNPPRIQKSNNLTLTWEEREFSANIDNIYKLGQHIRDIRNNLFHGGKFNGNFEHDISRNNELLNASLVILNAWLDLNEPVKESFLSDLS